ncbi:hypothetical protein PAPYR_5591 [Paratrimastix pyriformis]|uniref:Uncharacterized protein n=1 Tax=Paratrimastix pyriformis TaxID=342808 RepID=A0ABQ8UIK2_9EUKA|nr:hypothetical protein PAPYR_5591 [Paratrimastix pyriformis]
MEFLEKRIADLERYTNMLNIKGPRPVVESIRRFEEVFHARQSPQVQEFFRKYHAAETILDTDGPAASEPKQAFILSNDQQVAAMKAQFAQLGELEKTVLEADSIKGPKSRNTCVSSNRLVFSISNNELSRMQFTKRPKI